jgi:hypothetical protein
MKLMLLMVVAIGERGASAWASLNDAEDDERSHTVIVKPPAAAVAGMDVVAVPVDRAVDMVGSVRGGFRYSQPQRYKSGPDGVEEGWRYRVAT